jgi:hypothetical protein
MGYDVRIEEPPEDVDPFVETDDWSSPRGPGRIERVPLWFVDGVRRTELRLIADTETRRVRGLLGSFAVGAVRCATTATYGDHEVKRALVLGGGERAEALDVACGRDRLVFEPRATPGNEPDDPLVELQHLMREAEGNMAARLADERESVVLMDGPLAPSLRRAPTRCPVVGVVKRFGREYLEPAQHQLLPRLRTGQRTPLFAFSAHEVRRYAWYARVAELRGPWHDHAGIVRCEARGALEIAGAAEIADRVTSYLPAFAGRPQDPRTPQNLLPVAGLEVWLRHRLGDVALLRRALLAYLTEREQAA